MRFCWFPALLLALLFGAIPDVTDAHTIQGKKLDTLKAAIHAALKADPDEADVTIEIKNDRLLYDFDRLVSLFSSFERQDEMQHLAVAEAIRLKYPELEKEWKPHFAALDRSIQNQLQIPNNENRYIDADKESRSIVNKALQRIAVVKGAKDGAAPSRVVKAHFFQVRLVTDPPGGRKYYCTVFKYALMKGLGMPEDAWQEVLTDVIAITGNHYFKAQWPNQPSKRYGPHKVASDGPLLLIR